MLLSVDLLKVPLNKLMDVNKLVHEILSPVDCLSQQQKKEKCHHCKQKKTTKIAAVPRKLLLVISRLPKPHQLALTKIAPHL